MTPDTIKRLEELESKAAAAPWERGRDREGCMELDESKGTFAEVFFDPGDDEDQPADSDIEAVATIELIAALRNHAKALIRAAKRERLLQEVLDSKDPPGGLENFDAAMAALKAFDAANPGD